MTDNKNNQTDGIIDSLRKRRVNRVIASYSPTYEGTKGQRPDNVLAAYRARRAPLNVPTVVCSSIKYANQHGIEALEGHGMGAECERVNPY